MIKFQSLPRQKRQATRDEVLRLYAETDHNNTQVIDKDYQLVLLLAKSETIEKSLKKVGDKYYRKESFVYVLNTGLNREISVSLSFQDIRQLLINLYNAA